MIINTKQLLEKVKNDIEAKHAKYSACCTKNIKLIEGNIGSNLNELLSDNDFAVDVPIRDGELGFECFATYRFKSGEFIMNTRDEESFSFVTDIANEYQLLSVLYAISNSLSISGLHQK